MRLLLLLAGVKGVHTGFRGTVEGGLGSQF